MAPKFFYGSNNNQFSSVISMDKSDSIVTLNNRLKQSVLKWLPKQSRFETKIPGLALTRYDENTPAIKCFYSPMVALVIQGFKHSMIGGYEANYGQLHCVTVGIDMPGVFHITDASPDLPFLSLSIKLDRQIISNLIADVPQIIPHHVSGVPPIVVDEVSNELLEAFIRLVDLLDSPTRIPILAPMIIREIHYYLLSGNQESCLRIFNTTGTQANQLSQAISWLRDNFTNPLNMEELALRFHMAPSTFNRHFKQVTGMSPLQFQKRLRLNEAERLMLVEGKHAGTAALMVGYESESQFNREYKRYFGAPPRRDVVLKRS